MSLPRRRFLGSVVGGGVFAGLDAACTRSPAPPLIGEVLGRHRAERGHRLWVPPTVQPPAPPSKARVVVVGAGVAGLGACWQLLRRGLTDIVLLELDDRVGGTAQAGRSTHPITRGQRYALGAHYLTLPNPENTPTRTLLAELGVITGFDAQTGRAHYAPEHLCLAPQERLHVAGEWVEGLWPTKVASAEDNRQRAAWQALVDHWTHHVGADGRPAFSIPVAHASRDPRIRALAEVSFADWLTDQGLTSPVLRWLLEYATRDDFGTRLEDTSAWAGLHYHCARRPDPFDDRDLGTHVFTWPSGNGWLVERLAERIEGPVRIERGSLVRAVEADTGWLHVERVADQTAYGLQAEHVVLALPSGLSNRLLGQTLHPAPTAAPWRVAVVHCDAPPQSRGVPLAWDSVRYDTDDLGAISNAHQHGTYGGPTILTWYQPLTGDGTAARRALLTASWASEAERVMSAMAPGHPDFRARVQRLDIWHWGHGTTRPTVGLHAGDALEALAAPVGRVHRAHTDLSGVSLFEEALWHGVRAANEVADRAGAHSAETPG